MIVGRRSSKRLVAAQRKRYLMMNYNGWMGGGMWIWTVFGVLLVVLLVCVINNVSKK